MTQPQIRIKNLNIYQGPSQRAGQIQVEVDSEAILDACKAASAKQEGERFELSHGGAIVIDHKSQLMWAANELDRCDYAAAESACASLRLGDFNDWRLPDESELSSLRDLTKYNPCIDTAFFKSNGGWTWTRTPCAWSSDYVWIIHFSLGYVDYYHRNYKAFVRPVRSFSAGQ